jgi:hypothetical protein
MAGDDGDGEAVSAETSPNPAHEAARAAIGQWIDIVASDPQGERWLMTRTTDLGPALTGTCRVTVEMQRPRIAAPVTRALLVS